MNATTSGYAAPTTISATLRAAADYIETHGWHRGYLYDDHHTCGRRCAVHRTGLYPASIAGAVRAALLGTAKWHLDSIWPPEHGAAVRAAYIATVEHLNAHLNERGAFGMRAPALLWQVTPGRTKRHVTEALRAAALTAPAAPFTELDRAPVIDLTTYRTTRPRAA